MDLEQAKVDLVSALGAEFLDERPNESVLVEALRAALANICGRAPLEETTVTLAGDGRTVDVGALLSDLIEVGAIMRETDAAYAKGEFVPSNWRSMGSGRVSLVGGDDPLTGEELAVRYRRAYTVAGLDGETTTTLPLSLQRAWVIWGCAEVVEIILRRKTYTSDKVDDDEGRRYQAVAREYRIRAEKMTFAQAQLRVLTWDDLGE